MTPEQRQKGVATLKGHLRHIQAIRQRFLDEGGSDRPAIARLDARIGAVMADIHKHERLV